jgi:uncharacterized protein YjbI with pentapeptide repeats
MSEQGKDQFAWIGAAFAGAAFVGAAFTGAAFVGAAFAGAAFTGAVFAGAAFTGATNSVLDNKCFSESKLFLASLYSANECLTRIFGAQGKVLADSIDCLVETLDNSFGAKATLVSTKRLANIKAINTEIYNLLYSIVFSKIRKP